MRTRTTVSKRSIQGKNLTVQNGRIITSAGIPLTLRGVTLELFRWSPNRRIVPFEDVMDRLTTAQSWGINALQLYVNPSLFEPGLEYSDEMMKELAAVVAWAKRNGVYVVIIPVNEIVWEYDFPVRDAKSLATRDSMPQFLEILCKRFASEKVLFGLETEPKFIDTNEQLQKRIDAIRKFSNNPIIISTVNFDGILDITESIPSLTDTNIILDFHPYLAKNIDNYRKQEVEIDKIKQARARSEFKEYPFMLGEYGGFWRNDFNTFQDLQIFTGIACWADRKDYSHFIYSLDNELYPLFDEQGALTPRGYIAKEVMGAGRADFCHTNAPTDLRFVTE